MSGILRSALTQTGALLELGEIPSLNENLLDAPSSGNCSVIVTVSKLRGTRKAKDTLTTQSARSLGGAEND